MPGGKDGQITTVWPFFSPFEIAVVAEINAVKFILFCLISTGTATNLIVDNIEAFTPLFVKENFFFLNPFVNVSEIYGSFLWEELFFIFNKRSLEISTPITVAFFLNQAAAIGPPTFPNP